MNAQRAWLALPLLFCFAAELHASNAEPPPAKDAGRLQLAIEKLNVVGSALYVAAHPDDENTAFLTWLSNGRKVRTAYLSMTRGDGGQNLVGSETGELLGVIRTQELLAARRLDGAEQFFTRGLDFGYSKSPEETLEIWERKRILADVVWVIRRFRPDVIVTRFPAHQPRGHGHHTASAFLAEEAFQAAADPTRFPEQLRYVEPWQAKRLVWNVYRFGSQGPDTTRDRVRVDLGAYDPLLGRSYTEIAGESRSMHKSQGFGAAERRGTYTNTFEHRLGEPAASDLFDGVDLTWARVPGAESVSRYFVTALSELRSGQPESALPALVEARSMLAGLGDDPIVTHKLAELDEVIRACLGLWIEAIAESPSASPGATVAVHTSALKRSQLPLTLTGVEILGTGSGNTDVRRLPFNEAAEDTFQLAIPADAEPTRPYWLQKPARKGSFEVEDLARIGSPESPPAFTARFRFLLAGMPLEYEVPVVYRWTDRVLGERYREFVVAPAALLEFPEEIHLFSSTDAREVAVRVVSGDAPVAGEVRLQVAGDWRVEPDRVPVRLGGAAADTVVRFRVTPPAATGMAVVRAELSAGQRTWGWRSVSIDESHIPVQTLFLPAQARFVRADVQTAGARVGYLMGSGDAVPEALRRMGYRVQLLEDDDVANGDLAAFDAIVTGVRAYNTRPELLSQQGRLLEYVEKGGRLIVQYNTANRSFADALGPYPFTISRDRVTREDAPMRLLRPDHPLVTTPNRITEADFRGWVQERGLYFANPWDDRYETLLASHDPGEEDLAGSLLYARYGQGVFIYTGLSWFRQLPAGVPGAYRLFANLIGAPIP